MCMSDRPDISLQRRQKFLSSMSVVSLQYCRTRLEQRLQEVKIELLKKQQGLVDTDSLRPKISDGGYDKFLFR